MQNLSSAELGAGSVLSEKQVGLGSVRFSLASLSTASFVGMIALATAFVALSPGMPLANALGIQSICGGL